MRKTGAMTLQDIERLLVEASRLSNHRHFVIAGSLTAIGAIMDPPLDMVISRDVDFYPKLDPARGFEEIASELAEGSDFHLENGFYADPITPAILALPSDWEARAVSVTMKNGIVATFIDINDMAISKLMRAEDNDIRWVKSALDAGIASSEEILARLPRVQNALPEDFEKVRQSISHLNSKPPKP